MDISTAKEVLEGLVRQDRIIRDYDVVTDYEQFCEKRCIAIETVLKELDKKEMYMSDKTVGVNREVFNMKENEIVEEYIKTLKEQDNILLKIINDARIPSYIRNTYADMYNELHIKIVDGQQ